MARTTHTTVDAQLTTNSLGWIKSRQKPQESYKNLNRIPKKFSSAYALLLKLIAVHCQLALKHIRSHYQLWLYSTLLSLEDSDQIAPFQYSIGHSIQLTDSRSVLYSQLISQRSTQVTVVNSAYNGQLNL
ncbi:hypothetical protein F511_33654 [Dorcoceras hygrometricum]|uniref:Uncharacterized protein n=1 Tax=Dorcoceras hygrometricum TaxID=472368 RepID=A0A2Z7C0G7_9LAMI|nr:hypothetical protein F511_33654 [Dorcoceras hygrometricum]